MPRRTRSGVLSLLLLSALACSQKSFQYRPTGEEAARLEQTASEFAAATRGDEQGSIALDPLGRQALLDLLREGLRSGALKEPDRELLISAAVVVGGPGTAGRPFTESELEGSAFDLATQLAADAGLTRAEARALGSLIGAPKPPTDAQRQRELREMIEALELTKCAPIEPRISYRGEILRHVEVPGSNAFSRWRETVSGLHLVSLQCEGTTGLLLMEDQGEGGRPRILAWQFFDPDVWPVVDERIRAALELPGES